MGVYVPSALIRAERGNQFSFGQITLILVNGFIIFPGSLHNGYIYIIGYFQRPPCLLLTKIRKSLSGLMAQSYWGDI